MKKIMNHSEIFVEESLQGILMAHTGHLKGDPENIKAIYRVGSPIAGKVAIVTGGGFGHLPVFLGYVGKGLCDGVAVGNTFTSPSFDTIWSVTQHVKSDAGVLYLYGNYMGDSMNFDMAVEMAELEDIKIATVRVSDDIASAPKNAKTERRGIAGIFFAYKLAGACADRMSPLEEVKRIAEKAVANTATYGVALSSCQLPSAQKPIFEMGMNEMEIGMGIHGEPGVKSGKLMTSVELTETLVPEIVNDLNIVPGDSVAVLINGLGATSQEELYILYKDTVKYLIEKEIEVVRSFVGEYATSFEMAGASISLLKLDNETLELLDAPAYSPFLHMCKE